MTISGTATLDGTALEGAKITVIDTEAGEVIGTTTTDVNGEYNLDPGVDTTVHCLLEYEDPNTGELHRSVSKPFIPVISDIPDHWSEAVHRYQFSDADSGTTTLTDSGSAASLSDAALVGDATWTQDAVHDGWAVDFGGGDQDNYASAPNRSTMAGFTSGMTATMWAHILDEDRRFGILTCYGTERGWYFEQNSLNQLRVYYSPDGTNFDSSQFPFSTYDQWVRLAIRWQSGQAFELFVDGSPVSPSTAGMTVSEINQPNSPLEFARATHSSGRYFPGRMDDVHLYDRALTDTEIQEDYDAYTIPAQ